MSYHLFLTRIQLNLLVLSSLISSCWYLVVAMSMVPELSELPYRP